MGLRNEKLYVLLQGREKRKKKKEKKYGSSLKSVVEIASLGLMDLYQISVIFEHGGCRSLILKIFMSILSYSYLDGNP